MQRIFRKSVPVPLAWKFETVAFSTVLFACEFLPGKKFCEDVIGGQGHSGYDTISQPILREPAAGPAISILLKSRILHPHVQIGGRNSKVSRKIYNCISKVRTRKERKAQENGREFALSIRRASSPHFRSTMKAGHLSMKWIIHRYLTASIN